MPNDNPVFPNSQDKLTTGAFWVCIACTLFTVVTVGLMVYGIYIGNGGSRLLAMLGSTGFVALALCSGGMRHGYGRMIFLGLCFCWLGDYLGPIRFEVGVTMFGVAHLAFSTGFLIHGISMKHVFQGMLGEPGIPFAILGGMAGVMGMTFSIEGWILRHAPEAGALVLAYGTIIGTMLVLSIGMVRTGRAGRIAFAAAIIFYISDIFVARGHYVTPGRINSLGCYPLYYSACLLFGWSAFFAARASAATATEIPAR